jgi:TetR/AcrR family transcriptional repressor of bet genes
MQVHGKMSAMPRVVDHEQRRREMVSAVWQLIADRGIEAVTLRAVAATAGVSMGRVQHYFSSRDELVLHGCRVMVDGAEQNFSRRADPDHPWDQLRVLVRWAVPTTPEFRMGTKVWFAYTAKAFDSPRIADLVRDAQRGSVALAADLLARAQAGRIVRADLDPEVVALRLLATSEGYAARVLVGSLDAAAALAALDADLEALRAPFENSPEHGA